MKTYRDNIESIDSNLLKISKLLNLFSFIRLFVFAASIGTLITLFSLNLITLFFVFFPILIICFALVIKRHDKINYSRKHNLFLKKINESEILKEACNLEEFDTGDKFIDQTHPYTSDLDVFGQHSIFQLVNRATTESGRILLSEWLSKPASNSEIYDRQNAIKELAPKLDWRQDFQASGMHFQNKKSDYANLLAWVERPIVLLKKQFWLLKKYQIILL